MFNFVSTVSWMLSVAVVSASASPLTPFTPQINSEHQPPPSPTINVNYSYYSLDGATIADIQHQMNQRGPWSELEAQHYFANTDWRVSWSYDYTMTDRGCILKNLQGKVDITFTLPQWRVPAEASPALVSSWNQFLGALQLHESGHMSHGVSAGQEVLQTLSQIPAAESCDALKTMARSAANQVIQHYNQQDLAYDHHTQHGVTQGAIFPPARPTVSQDLSQG